jgi:hypothetical protein
MHMRIVLPLTIALFMAVGWNSASAASSRRKNIAADSQTVYVAAQNALTHLHFSVTSSSFSDGKIEGYRVIGAAGGSHRILATLRIRDGFSGGTDLVFQLSQVAADDSGNPMPSAKPAPLTDNALADAFFESVDDEVGRMRR